MHGRDAAKLSLEFSQNIAADESDGEVLVHGNKKINKAFASPSKVEVSDSEKSTNDEEDIQCIQDITVEDIQDSTVDDNRRTNFVLHADDDYNMPVIQSRGGSYGKPQLLLKDLLDVDISKMCPMFVQGLCLTLHVLS